MAVIYRWGMLTWTWTKETTPGHCVPVSPAGPGPTYMYTWSGPQVHVHSCMRLPVCSSCYQLNAIYGYGNKMCSYTCTCMLDFFSRYSSGVWDFFLNVCQWLARDPERQQALWRHVSSSRSGIWCTSGHSLFSIRVLLSTVSDRKGKQFSRLVTWQCICFNSKPQFNFMAKQVTR